MTLARVTRAVTASLGVSDRECADGRMAGRDSRGIRTAVIITGAVPIARHQRGHIAITERRLIVKGESTKAAVLLIRVQSSKVRMADSTIQGMFHWVGRFSNNTQDNVMEFSNNEAAAVAEFIEQLGVWVLLMVLQGIKPLFVGFLKVQIQHRGVPHLLPFRASWDNMKKGVKFLLGWRMHLDSWETILNGNGDDAAITSENALLPSNMNGLATNLMATSFDLATRMDGRSIADVCMLMHDGNDRTFAVQLDWFRQFASELEHLDLHHIVQTGNSHSP